MPRGEAEATFSKLCTRGNALTSRILIQTPQVPYCASGISRSEANARRLTRTASPNCED